ncbi:MAG TPA: hypothetical protein VIW03_02150 [Anaeromyxobacter sp.]
MRHAPVVRGVRVALLAELSPEQRRAAEQHFRSVFAALTPLAVGPGHPFPQLRRDALHVAVSLAPVGRRRRARGDAARLAIVQVPAALPRLVSVPSERDEVYALLEEIVAAGAGELFPGNVVAESAPFRIRGGGLFRDGPARLELAARTSAELEASLGAALRIDPRAVQRLATPL